jgi:hypothetical protein
MARVLVAPGPCSDCVSQPDLGEENVNLFARIWAAFGRTADAADHVADNLDGLACTFKEANANVRHNLRLDAPVPEQARGAQPALPQGKGETEKKPRDKAAA